MNESTIEIYFESEYSISKAKKASEAISDYTFTKTIDGSKSIKVLVSYKKNTTFVNTEGFSVPKRFIDELSNLSRFEGDKLSDDCRDKINEILKIGREFVKQILLTLKYYLNHYDISEQPFAIRSQKWCTKSGELKDIPSQINVIASFQSICPLRDDTARLVQQNLDNNIQPLAAMRHLHRAKSENTPHHKWIDATIAAELAIKEVLSKVNPSFETLLLEMPSPSLAKLYGKILKEQLGESSPYRKEIIKGVQIRNKLIHRHDSPDVDSQKALNYVKNIEKAIFHLLSLLYPNNQLIKQTYDRALLN
ncbi:hypothetical protein [Gracilimonas tropica]|uniref:hypothetical protein n=1 Tax=Gracilimonas tropica TaxID=454600 RepID=UPI000379B01E|nr:hypothetical protein [Gracilimonas tropica]